jgi:hypothetical protein
MKAFMTVCDDILPNLLWTPLQLQAFKSQDIIRDGLAFPS